MGRALLRTVRENGKLQLGLAIIGVILLLALVQPLVNPLLIGEADPRDFGVAPLMERPSWSRPLGTDHFGHDQLALLLYSLRSSLLIGGLAGLISTAVGIVVGFTAGYKGGWLDTILRSTTDMVLVIPTLPLLLILTASLREINIFWMALVLSVFGWPFAARVIRAQVLSLRERPYVELSKLNHQNDLEIIFGELVPNLLPFLGLGLASSIVGAILAETGLQLIGFGPGTISTLGSMIYQALQAGMVTQGRVDAILAPAAVLILLFLGLNLINMGFEEIYNPRLRGVTAD
jgi:peptide/nickel transport system permease protein